MWLAANEPATTAFQKAEDMLRNLRAGNKISENSVKNIASAGVHSIIDGGFTDNTGIINAVAAGSTELHVWLNTNLGEDGAPQVNGVLNLFEGGKSGKPSRLAGDMLFFQIFSTDTDDAKAQIDQFQKLDHQLDNVNPEDDTIVDFRAGTIETTTVDNPVVGIQGGIKVTLKIFIVTSSLTIGYLEDFNNYATLVGQIVGTLEKESNKEVVVDMLGSMVRGEGALGSMPRAEAIA